MFRHPLFRALLPRKVTRGGRTGSALAATVFNAVGTGPVTRSGLGGAGLGRAVVVSRARLRAAYFGTGAWRGPVRDRGVRAGPVGLAEAIPLRAAPVPDARPSRTCHAKARPESNVARKIPPSTMRWPMARSTVKSPVLHTNG